jgi:hypothetical protein
MKKIFLQIIFILFLSVSAHSEDQPVYVELICAPDNEWEGMASKNKKIWFPSFQPKFLIHMDLEEMKVVKIGYSKNEDEIRDVSIQIEKSIIDGNTEYQFIKSGSLNENLNVFNIIKVLSSDFLVGLFVNQYQLNTEVTNFIINEMQNDTASEFERAMKLYTKKSGRFIGYTGGSSTSECKRVRKYK